ncbi:hypothetical protein Agub_g9455, partial [Astrephomene gubernaculifera]
VDGCVKAEEGWLMPTLVFNALLSYMPDCANPCVSPPPPFLLPLAPRFPGLPLQSSSSSSPASSAASPFLALMQQYTRLVLLTLEVVAADPRVTTTRPLRRPETVTRPSGYDTAFTSTCDLAFANSTRSSASTISSGSASSAGSSGSASTSSSSSASTSSSSSASTSSSGSASTSSSSSAGSMCPPRGLAVRLLVAFMGAVRGSEWSLGRFVEGVRVAYDQGLAADELFSQLEEWEFAQSGGLLPIADPSRTAAAAAAAAEATATAAAATSSQAAAAAATSSQAAAAAAATSSPAAAAAAATSSPAAAAAAATSSQAAAAAAATSSQAAAAAATSSPAAAAAAATSSQAAAAAAATSSQAAAAAAATSSQAAAAAAAATSSQAAAAAAATSSQAAAAAAAASGVQKESRSGEGAREESGGVVEGEGSSSTEASPPPPQDQQQQQQPAAPEYEITKQLLSCWISLSYMALAQLQVPYPAAGQRLGWAWAGFGDPIEAIGMNDFVGNVLRGMAGADPRVIPQPPTHQQQPQEQQQERWKRGGSTPLVRVEDESLPATSTAVRVFAQQVALVQAVCRSVMQGEPGAAPGAAAGAAAAGGDKEETTD